MICIGICRRTVLIDVFFSVSISGCRFAPPKNAYMKLAVSKMNKRAFFDLVYEQNREVLGGWLVNV